MIKIEMEFTSGKWVAIIIAFIASIFIFGSIAVMLLGNPGQTRTDVKDVAKEIVKKYSEN